MRHYSLAQQATEQAQRLTHYREAIKLYKGAYASEISYTWAVTLREAFQQYYLNILLQVAQLYLEASDHEQALEFCQRAIEADNLMEEAYRLSLRIYAAMGNRAGLVRQYQRCRDVLQREINAEPSQQTQSLYQELSRLT
jgi:two-component SAPR family response regulator